MQPSAIQSLPCLLTVRVTLPRYRLQSVFTLAAYLLYSSSFANLSPARQYLASSCSSRFLYTYKAIILFNSEFYLCFYTINTKGLEMRHYSNSKNEKRTGATSSPSSCVISLEIVLSLSRNPQANNCPYLFSLTIHSRKNGSSIS